MSFHKRNLLIFFAFCVLVCEATTSEKLSPELSAKLCNLLRPLREVTLHIQTNQDPTNSFEQFFLNQSICPVKVFSNATVVDNNNDNNVISTGTSELQNLLETFSSRETTQFYIIKSTFESSGIVEVARSVWSRWGIFKNYYLTAGSIYFYNPFAVVGDGPERYGALQAAKSNRDFYEIFDNLNGYPLRTYIFQSVFSKLSYDENSGELKSAEGPDVTVAYLIANDMNCRLVLQEPDEEFFGHRLENGSFDGAIGRTIRYETDLTLTGFFVKDYLSRDMEFSVTVYMDELCCYVRKAKRIPQSILPLFSVNIDMWMGFLGAAFLWAAIWSILRKCNLWIQQSESQAIPSTMTQHWQYIRILIDTWVIWVRANIVRYPPFSSEKIFVISLCLVSVIFGAIFESSLATVYINPMYYKDIDTIQELDETQLRIIVKHAAMKDDLFYGSSSEMFKRLYRKMVFVAENEDRIIEMLSRRGGFASVARASSLIIDDISYILSRKIHMIPECPKKYHIAYPMPKESPFRERVNDLLLHFLSAGLINYWIESMYHKSRIGLLKSPDILKHMGGYTWKKLTIEDLQLPFYVVVLGSILAALAFIAEISIGKWLSWGIQLKTT